MSTIAATRTTAPTPRRAGLLSDLEHPWDAVAHLGPNWFASVTGTGIVANAAVTLPLQFPGLRVAATVVWVLASTLLVGVTVAFAAHWVRHLRWRAAAGPAPRPGHAPPGHSRVALLRLDRRKATPL